jgi:hypothetical protein
MNKLKFIKGFRLFDNSLNEIKNLELVLKTYIFSNSFENSDFIKMNSFIRERINPNYKEYIKEENINYLGEPFFIEERENNNGESFVDYVLPSREFYSNANSIILGDYKNPSNEKRSSKDIYENKLRDARYAFIYDLKESK